MRIAFVWYWGRAKEIYPNWRDGLRAALEVLSRDHKVDIFLGEIEPPDNYDFILFWGDSDCPFFEKVSSYHARKGIILTTDPHNIGNLGKLDVVYCESTPVYNAVRAHGIHAIKAFGTDVSFYKPDLSVSKEIEFFYPATFSPWKRQRVVAHLGNRLLCVGTLQPDGKEELAACKANGVLTLEGYFPPEEIRLFYHRAKHVPIPAIHGSERTALEAMSMNIVPSITPSNKRTFSYLEEYIRSGFLTPRDFVLVNYSQDRYAEALLKGMHG